MVADVPLGAFLSGGIDSSLVVALMQKESRHPIRTFTIGFHEQVYDEAPFAAAIARHLGTDHTEVYVTAREAIDVVPLLSEIWDEPFADSSQIPTYLVSKMARQHVTVALSGDGGDELYGGYTRYFRMATEWRKSRALPPLLRKTLAGLATSIAVGAPEAIISALVPLLLALGKPTSVIRERLLWRAHAWKQDDLAEFYLRHASFATNPRVDSFIAGAIAEIAAPCDLRSVHAHDVIELMMAMDLFQYLPDDILTKVDRASMAASLEARVPLLDHRCVELAWRLPFSVRYGQGHGKALLKALLEKYVPRSLFQRPKQGFGIPFGEWLRGPLREWAEPLLSPSALEESGLYQTSWLRDRWSEHLSGAYDHRNLLWSVLIFEDWRRHWKAS
jgi:asparagine synthase (glutamine-hydrolysing)